jgi:histidine triad (HIT) family protein
MPCVFCQIRDGEIPAIRVAEEERAFAFMDRNPVNDGHVLIAPRAHAGTLFDIPEEELLAVMRLTRRVAAGIRESLRPEGLHLLQNSGRAAFQSVPHFHVHLIPRWSGDGRGFNWQLVPGDLARMQATAEQIRTRLSGR